MPGFVTGQGACCACGTPIVFNPHRVPSIRINGEKEPLCRSCFAQWNEIHRISKGLDPVPLDPEAYDPAQEGDGP